MTGNEHAPAPLPGVKLSIPREYVHFFLNQICIFINYIFLKVSKNLNKWEKTKSAEWHLFVSKLAPQAYPTEGRDAALGSANLSRSRWRVDTGPGLGARCFIAARWTAGRIPLKAKAVGPTWTCYFVLTWTVKEMRPRVVDVTGEIVLCNRFLKQHFEFILNTGDQII